MIGRLAEHWVGFRVESRRGLRGSVQQFDDTVAVDGVVGRLAHPFVAKGRVAGRVEDVRPGVRVRPQADLETGRFEAINRIGGRYFDPVYLAGAQRSDASIGLWHRHHDYAVELRDAVFVPIVRVARHLDADPGRHFGDFERAGTGRRLRELGPIVAGLLPCGRADDQDARYQIREVAERHSLSPVPSLSIRAT